MNQTFIENLCFVIEGNNILNNQGSRESKNERKQIK